MHAFRRLIGTEFILDIRAGSEASGRPRQPIIKTGRHPQDVELKAGCGGDLIKRVTLRLIHNGISSSGRVSLTL